MNPIILHINYLETTYFVLGGSIRSICEKAAKWGYNGIEFRGKVPTNFEGSLEAYLDEIAAAKKEFGLTHIVFGKDVEGCSSSDADVRAKALQTATDFFAMAHDKVGSCLFNTFADFKACTNGNIAPGCYDFNGSYVATEDEWKYTADTYQKLGRTMEQRGIKLAFETHMSYIHDRPASTKKLVDLIDSAAVGVNMDYGNTIYFVNVPSPAETVELYGDKLFYMHLKNSITVGNLPRVPTSLAQGEINHRTYLAKVKEIGFHGPIGIEAPRGGDREWFAREDLAYFKSVAEELGL